MKQTRLPTLPAVILAMGAWFTLQFLMGCSKDMEAPPRSYADMKQQAVTAISDVGGVEILGQEATSILTNSQVGSTSMITTLNSGTNCPAITKLDSLLNPNGIDSWVVMNQEKLRALPAHVVVRFGSHAYYQYVWIFDPAHVPLEKIERVEHLGGAVYLSEDNL